MADQNHLEILKKGVEVWNQWRKINPDVRPDLCGANLYGANLYGANLEDVNLMSTDLIDANLEGANLGGANLIGANLTIAKLSRAKLIGTNFGGANLVRAKLDSADIEGSNFYGATLMSCTIKGANLKRVEALATNFAGAILTGACIKDWNINSKTNLQNVKCDYIYLKENYSEEENKWIYSDRRPHNGNFKEGEFAQLFQKALETVDLIFSEGIEWTAFLESFQQLQEEVKSEELGIQAIEKKSEGAFVIRLEVPQEANKAEIEKYIKQEYDMKLKVIEANYQKQLEAKDETIQAYREKSMDMFELTKIIAKNQPDITNNISVVSGDSYSAKNAGILHNEKGDISGNAKVASEINEAGKQDD